MLGISVRTPGAELRECNAVCARCLGCACTDESIGTSRHGLCEPAGDRDRLVVSVRAQGQLEPHRGRFRRSDGSVVTVIETVVGEFDADGELTELRGFLVDVTASDEAEAAPYDGERQFRALFFDAADAMVILDD